MTTTIKRVDPISYGINLAAVMAIMMFIMLLIIFLFSTLIGGFASNEMDSSGGTLGMLGMIGGMGIMSLILGPILYAIFGFIFGALGAMVYNIAAKMTGGIKIDLEDEEMYE